MPQPYRIQVPSDALRAILTSFGVVTPPALWELNNSVQPVSIVDSRVNINAVATREIWSLRSTAGELTAPLANTRWFDTGQLAAGDYSFQIFANCRADVVVRIIQRNAADTADINSMLQSLSVGNSSWARQMVFTVALNERVVFENVAQPVAGSLCQAVAFSLLL